MRNIGVIINNVELIDLLYTKIEAGSKNKKMHRYLAKCHCGKEFETWWKRFRAGHVKSCGCHIKTIKPYTGVVFGPYTLTGVFKKEKLTVLREGVCSCGEKVLKKLTAFKKIKSSSCYHSEQLPVFKPLSEEKVMSYNNLFPTNYSVIGEGSHNRDSLGRLKRSLVLVCRCNIRKEMSIRNFLKEKPSGCLKCYIKKPRIIPKEVTDLAKFRKKLRHRYHKMKERCYNPKDKSYVTYGAKGISVCKEWLESFEVYFDWCIKVGLLENPDFEIDRLDPNKNYTPENCRLIPKELNCLYAMKIDMENYKKILVGDKAASKLDGSPISEKVFKRLEKGLILKNLFEQTISEM